MLLPLFIEFRWLDMVDIVLVAILIYQLYNLVKGTVAIRIFIGILSIYILWKFVEVLKMELLTEILGQFIGVGVIALIIVFQQEIRRFLILIGTTGFRDIPLAKRLFKWKGLNDAKFNTDSIVKACVRMSRAKTGALIILPRESDIDFEVTGGDTIDAKSTPRLIETIFFKNSPLHDGAIIIKNNRILSARCVLPVSENQAFPARYGMRHRAAAGITENSDAISVIVSEQTGEVAIAKKGEIISDISFDDLRKFLDKEFNL